LKVTLRVLSIEGENLTLRKSLPLNTSLLDILKQKNQWKKMVKTVSNGEIVKKLTDKVRKRIFQRNGK
jgi:hypothetical protein